MGAWLLERWNSNHKKIPLDVCSWVGRIGVYYYEIDQPIGVHGTSMIALIDLSLDTLDMVS